MAHAVPAAPVAPGTVRVRWALEYAVARVALATLAWLPRPAAEWMGRLYARVLDRALPRLRRIAERNLQMTGFAPDPARRREIIDGIFRSIGRLLLAIARFPQIRRENVARWIRYQGLEHFTSAKRAGKGVLFATAHLGNWELSAFAHALMSEPMHVVVRPLDNPFIDRLVERYRGLSGNRLIEKKSAARAILEALKANEAVGILIDQNASPDEGVFINFLGVPACAGDAFARIAARTGAAVIPGFALWSETEKRYILHFDPPVEISGDPAEDTRRIHARLEAVIREYPDQWLWIHRRWKTRPAGEPALY